MGVSSASIGAVIDQSRAAPHSAQTGYERLLDVPEDLLDVLPAAVYVCDADGLILRYNRKAVELWGRTPRLGESDERFCGAWRLYRLDGGALPHAQTPMADVLRTGRAARDQEVVIERPDGSRITALVNIEPLRNGSGGVTGAINCFQEITARKRAETLDGRERRARELLEALPAAIYTTDPAGRITFYNQAAVDLWGYRPEPGSDRWCGSWRLFWPDGTPMPHDQCPMAAALKENRPIRGAEAILERPDGTRVTFLPYPTPLRDASGALIGAVNMLVDITDRKTSEAALREREKRLKLLAREVDHRANNMLATVQAITRMTRADSVPAFAEALMGRFSALSRAHALLAESRWTGADLKRLIDRALAPFGTGEGDHVAISGPELALSPGAAQELAMCFHELATNAAKYGALSIPGGRVAVDWNSSPQRRLVLRWIETGGPQIQAPPSRRGFGTGLIESTIKRQLGGEVAFDWRAEGLTCEMSLPGDKLVDR